MCIFHRWRYIGLVSAFRWLGGVRGGVKIEHLAGANRCEKCGKIKLLTESEQ